MTISLMRCAVVCAGIVALSISQIRRTALAFFHGQFDPDSQGRKSANRSIERRS